MYSFIIHWLKTYQLFINIFLISLFSCQAMALDKFSHQLVCQLAFEHLPKAKQARINLLLNQLPAKQQKLINQYNYKKSNTPVSFASSCTWADAIKKWPEFDKYKSWHYLNMPRNAQQVDTQNYKTQCQNGCIITAIETHLTALMSASSLPDKAQALMFLGHWLGDIHQPLHISFADDKGGNKTAITSTSKCKNLHWYWDECLLTSKKSVQQYQGLLQTLKAMWPTATHSQMLTTNAPVTWANESFQLVLTPEIGYCQLTNKQPKACIKQNEKLIIDENYQQHHQHILKQQLLKAAYRLQQVLLQHNF